jgi:predicted secreted protein
MLLVVVLIPGYVVLWAIWHFGFRNRDEQGRRTGGSTPGAVPPRHERA